MRRFYRGPQDRCCSRFLHRHRRLGSDARQASAKPTLSRSDAQLGCPTATHVNKALLIEIVVTRVNDKPVRPIPRPEDAARQYACPADFTALTRPLNSEKNKSIALLQKSWLSLRIPPHCGGALRAIVTTREAGSDGRVCAAA
jgi:hypothetical protein